MARPEAAYETALAEAGCTVREDPLDFSASELDIQAQWFAGEFGNTWQTEDGRRVVFEDFGRWNREPGPDFVDARVRFDEDRPLTGAVEIDRSARDWESHGHASNPAFRDVLLHFFIRKPHAQFFTRTCEHRQVSQVHLTLPATAPSAGKRAASSPPITTQAEAARTVVLSAARHRLAAKHASFLRHVDMRGYDDALFCTLAMALGYKRNTIPFLLLAQRVGLKLARSGDGEALLFGAAGFLESPTPPAAPVEVRSYLRTLWETWWRLRAGHQRWVLPATAWNLAAIRPANHPQRRTAALAAIAVEWPSVRSAFDSSLENLQRVLESLTHEFWNTRFNLAAAKLKRPQSLIGAQRISDIAINIWYPLAIDRDGANWEHFVQKRGPAPASIMKAAAHRFFGNALDGSLNRAAIQQGLLQVERDANRAPDFEGFRAALARRCAGSTRTAS